MLTNTSSLQWSNPNSSTSLLQTAILLKNYPPPSRSLIICRHTFNVVVLELSFAVNICDDRSSSKKRRRKKLIKNENVNTVFNAVVVLECSFAEKVCDDRLSSKRIRKNLIKKEKANTLFNAVVLEPNFAEKICDDRLSSKRRRKNLIKKRMSTHFQCCYCSGTVSFAEKTIQGGRLSSKRRRRRRKPHQELLD
jgi:hypothetical protein